MGQESTLVLVEFLAGLVIFTTLWALLSHTAWWVRCLDFPRLQILSVGVFTWLMLLVASLLQGAIVDPILWLLLTGAVLYQAWMILPYTLFWRKQVHSAAATDPEHTISLLVSNVLTPNTNHQALIDHVRRYQPDVLVTLESDHIWERALSVIESDYPYVVRVPLDNLYGMHLYSRLPLVRPEVKFLLSPEIPSIHTGVRLRSGQVMQLYCLHPKPPTPHEAPDSTLRDAELLMVGQHVATHKERCVVLGDLNDVAWSRTTRLFQRISGLLDPRVGRKFMNTFHVDYWLLRWSLDHVFHSNDFSLVDMQLLSSIGSDHYPVYTVLHVDPAMKAIQPAPVARAGDRVWADAKIQAGIAQALAECPTHERDVIAY